MTLQHNEIAGRRVTYDSIARFDPFFDTINDLIKELKESDNRYEDDDFEQIIQCLENIYNKYNLDMLCPKYEAIRKIIDSERAKQRSVGIISSNKIRNIALKEKLASTFGVEIGKLEDLGIRFFNKKKLINKQQFIDSDTVVMLSSTNVSDFNIFNNLEELKIHVLLYKIEITELLRKFSRLKEIDNKALSFINPIDREVLITNNIYKYFFNRLKKHVAIQDTSNSHGDSSITELSNLIKTDKKIPLKRSVRDYKGNNVVFAKLVELEGNGAMFFRKNSKVRYLNKKKKKIIIKKLLEIKNEDEIVLIDNDSRKELFNVFINNSKVDNQSIKNHHLIEEWREKYEDKYVSLKYNDEKLFKEMKELGWDKSTKSILSNWRSGYSFGPRDLKDLEILGKALNIEAFSERANDYHDAMSSIRVERRVAARLLNKIIYYSKRAINNEDLAFLSKYNLSFDDVTSAVKVRKVIGVSKKVYKVKPSEVGILFE
nr:DISARM system-associated protein DrmE [Halobacillus salinarum]